MLKSELVAQLAALPDGVVYDTWGYGLVAVSVDEHGTPDGPGVVLHFDSVS